MGCWLQSAPGRYLLEWEQGRLEDAVADAFGFHALQLGLPEVDALHANRMPHRWRIDDRPAARVALVSEFDNLPLAADSVDLVVLPHTLEFAPDPHLTLREVERVLRPEGRIVITGFNPTSLWGLRQRLSRTRLALHPSPSHPEREREGEFIGYWRVRDWLRLLGFAIEGGQFGCWRPPVASARWLARFQWMDRVGERWWPVLGAAYLIVAVKRVKGMRLVGLARPSRRGVRAAAPVAARRDGVAAREREREHA
ncbi:MAG TPA: class I SAM-dependent methyltransferase [Rubrivivax sp.]|nr:class I SAM-dependent methyltransferase [Burkholderiales bacterium]HNU12589.1 class I SAM-dependent methyltransferase [Rubrivivax sp.]